MPYENRLGKHTRRAVLFFGVASAAGRCGDLGRRSRFGRGSALYSHLTQFIATHLFAADTGASTSLYFSTLITSSLGYKAERGQVLHPHARSSRVRVHAHVARPRLPFDSRGVSWKPGKSHSYAPGNYFCYK